MPTPRRRRRHALAALVALLAAACSGAASSVTSPGASPTPTPVTSPSASSPAPSPTTTPSAPGQDVTYARVDGEELRLDWYAPSEGTEPRPALVLVHGGGWVAGDRDELTDAARWVTQLGFVGITIDYRLAPWTRFPGQAEDVATALRWVADHADELGVDPERIIVAGTSAGGNLASLVSTWDRAGVEHPRPAGVISWSGIYDLRLAAEIVDANAPQPWVVILRAYLGCLPDGDDPACADRYEAASPAAQVDADDPPMLILHGRDDALPVADARALRDRRDQAALLTRLKVYDTDAHGVELFEASAQPVERFLREFGGVG